MTKEEYLSIVNAVLKRRNIDASFEIEIVEIPSLGNNLIPSRTMITLDLNPTDERAKFLVSLYGKDNLLREAHREAHNNGRLLLGP